MRSGPNAGRVWIQNPVLVLPTLTIMLDAMKLPHPYSLLTCSNFQEVDKQLPIALAVAEGLDYLLPT